MDVVTSGSLLMPPSPFARMMPDGREFSAAASSKCHANNLMSSCRKSHSTSTSSSTSCYSSSKPDAQSSANGVRAKIALFSTNKSCISPPCSSSVLVRSLTHTDVRYEPEQTEQAKMSTKIALTSRHVSGPLFKTAAISNPSFHAASTPKSTMDSAGGAFAPVNAIHPRSRSLMDIGASSERHELDHGRRKTLSKLPEVMCEQDAPSEAQLTKRRYDSDEDEWAVSSGRSSMSQPSASPPSSPVSRLFLERKSSTPVTVQLSSKKPSLEALNRYSASSHKEFAGSTSVLGRPASRSSSFTIAERKKSFEAAASKLSETRWGSLSSQDYLNKKKSDTHSLAAGLGLRRHSNDCSVSVAASKSDSLASSEASYPSTRSGSIVSIIERLPLGTKSELCRPVERPSDLCLSPRKISFANSKISPSSSKSFKELADLWQKSSSFKSSSPSCSSDVSVGGFSDSKTIKSKYDDDLDSSLPPAYQMSAGHHVATFRDVDHAKNVATVDTSVSSQRKSPDIDANQAQTKIFTFSYLDEDLANDEELEARAAAPSFLNDNNLDLPLECSKAMSMSSSSSFLIDSQPASQLADCSSRRCVSVNDMRKAFEKAEQSLSDVLIPSPVHNRMPSLDSTTSEESCLTHNGSASSLSLISGHKEHYGSITSLASSTSLISPQELQGLIDEANQSLEESGTPSHEIMVIVLHRECTAGSIGITLAGGVDYENKEITVHKIIPGTLADRDGRIQKGDRVLSINGRSTKGVTHREALTTLKAPRSEVVLVLSRSRSVTPAATNEVGFDYHSSYNYNSNNSNRASVRPPKILESPLDSKSLLSDVKFIDVARGPPMTVVLKKGVTGLGFSLEGGKDSPVGDRPLTIKKIFAGGAADKSDVLKVGDEILMVNNADCSRKTRLEAWNFMKKLPDGYATLVVRQRLDAGSLGQSESEAPSTSSNIVDGNERQSDTQPSPSDT